ncbi:MAG TPA: YhjD/YihY/BrkB family envelope integrity protein [Solirubrobacteraceae bacterium]|jgi:membrane protein|nr:YhjD/YihY/BrkB family envelope integrity protein [Solirubrobacteraceae bacterium]
MTPQADSNLDWEGQPMLDRSGDELGTIEEIYLVEETGRPEWAVVRLAGRGGRRTLVPLTAAAATGNGIRAAYEKRVVKDAPGIGGDAEPSMQQVADVYRHYGIAYESSRATSGGGDGAAASREGGSDRDRPSPARSSVDGVGQAGVGATLKRTVKEFSDDNLTHWAAALTYYGVLSIFPALLAVVSILGLIGSSAIQPLMDNLTTVAPGPAKQIVTGALKGLQQGSGSGVLFVVALAGAVWSASGYISAFMDASNAVYDIEEGRPIWKKLPLRIAITVLMLVLLSAGALAVVLTGPVAEQAGKLFGVGDSALQVWNIAKWPVLVLIASFMFAVLYYSAPNVKQPGVRSVLPGGILAVVLWVIASAAFALYVASFGSYNKTYGALGGVIVFLVWLWLTNLAILLGAEFNAERARTRHIQAGHPADEEPYLPPRSRP